MINKIVNEVERISVPLREFTMNVILDGYDTKLKTIETLLNVYFEFEEQDDESVVLFISGDLQGCHDAKKLVFEEMGTFRSQHGHMFKVPAEMMAVVQSFDGVRKVVHKVSNITGARLMYMKGPDGIYIFVSGYPNRVMKALEIFRKINIELVCSTMAGKKSELVNSVDDLCNLIETLFCKRISISFPPKTPDQVPEQAAEVEALDKAETTRSDNGRYTKGQLIGVLRNMDILPLLPSLASKYQEDVVTRDVILLEGRGEKCLENSLRLLNNPIFRGYEC